MRDMQCDVAKLWTLFLLAISMLTAAAPRAAAVPLVGWAGSDPNHIDASNAEWYYNWWHTPIGDSQNSNATFVPLIKYTNNLAGKLNIIAGYENVDTVLVLNEPERVDQSNVSVAEALSIWPQVQTALPNHTLVSPGVSDDPAGRAWLTSFMGEVEARNANGNPGDDLRVDAIAFHWYGASSPNNPVGAANNFLSRVDWYHQTFNRPVWITEFAMHDWGGNHSDEVMLEANALFLETVIPGLESRSFVHAYAFYHHFSDARLFNGASPTGDNPVTPTVVGDVYVDTTKVGQTFDLAGTSLGTDVRYLRGGALVNSGTNLGIAMRGIDSLEGSATFGGTSNWGVGGANAFVRVRPDSLLAKVGDNTVTFESAQVINDGALHVSDGTLQVVEGSITGSGAIHVSEGATLQLTTTASRGQYQLAGQQIELAGVLDANVRLAAASQLTSIGSAARVASHLFLQDSTLTVGGAGFNELVPAVAPVTTGLQLNFDAALDTAGDNRWDSATGTQSLAFASATSPVSVSPTALPGIQAAYAIASSGAATGLQNYFEGGGPRSERDATFEIVFRVADTNAGNDQILFEAGGSARGTALTLSGNQLRFSVNAGGDDAQLTHSLAAGWHHAIGVIDFNPLGDTVSLYVNGQNVGSVLAGSIVDWAGGNPLGLGGVADSASGIVGTPSNFHSNIALMRYYGNYAFTSADVLQNYESIAVSPTATASTLTVDGNFTLSVGSILQLDIGDQGEADRVAISEELRLNLGAIEISHVGSGPLAAGDRWQLFDFAQAAGTLGSISLPVLDPQLMWHTESLLATGEISIALAGDYNADGTVDAADYTVWREQLGSEVLTTADGNGDGMVDNADYAIWRANFGLTASSLVVANALAVPEPSACLLAFVSLFILLCFRSPQRSLT